MFNKYKKLKDSVDALWIYHNNLENESYIEVLNKDKTPTSVIHISTQQAIKLLLEYFNIQFIAQPKKSLVKIKPK